jgi:hypothetical protein
MAQPVTEDTLAQAQEQSATLARYRRAGRLAALIVIPLVLLMLSPFLVLAYGWYRLAHMFDLDPKVAAAAERHTKVLFETANPHATINPLSALVLPVPGKRQVKVGFEYQVGAGENTKAFYRTVVWTNDLSELVSEEEREVPPESWDCAVPDP